MVTDHSKTNDELKQIATKKNIAVPSEPDPAHKVAATKLHAKSGAAFDQAFKAQMVADHKATIALFQTEAKSGGDANLKALLPRPCPICRST
jgi:putative membrane protein